MDIIKYLQNIGLDSIDEEQVKKFLSSKEEDIKASILKIWTDYSTNKSKDGIANYATQTEKSNDEKVIVYSSPGIIVNGNDATINIDEKTGPIEDTKIPILLKNEQESPHPLTGKVSSKETIQNKTDIVQKNTDTLFDQQIRKRSIIIPNGKENQPYKFLFDLDELGLKDIGDYWIEGTENLGLSFDNTTNELSGIPVIAGDHKIKLKIKRNDWSDGKPIFERELLLIVNPDPKNLWKNIPTPTDVEYFKPDSDKCFIKVEPETEFFMPKKPKRDMVAASQRGRSHAQEGKPRDDHFSLKYLKGLDWYIISVADGAGSAKSSRRGSEIACDTVSAVCEELLKAKHKDFENHIKEFNKEKTEENRKIMGDTLYGILGNAVFKSVKKIEEESKLSNKPLKDFSTTLIVSICKKFKFGWFVGAFWVGDGGIGIYDDRCQYLKILGEADSGEFAGQTRFLTMPEISESKELYRRLRFEIVDDFRALILMTDGVTDPIFETDANLQKVEKWNEFWQDLRQNVELVDNNEKAADQLLNWLDFWSPGNHDDRTIAILF